MKPSPGPFVAPRSRRLTRRRLVALAVVGLLGLVALPACGTEPATTAFRGVPVGTAQPDSFTASVGSDQVGVEPPARVQGGYAATTPGLFGGGGSGPPCDPAALEGHLGADPARADAWAAVLGIRPGEIGAYVTRLTPVVLRADTAVTSHGFANGSTIPRPSVLQAGTAVLVDDRGVPAVQCASGNPLTAASTADATYEGADWEGFRPEAVTRVLPAPAPVASLVIADPTGNGVVRPIGTSGAADTPYVAPDPDAAPAEPAPTASRQSGPAGDYPGSALPDSDYPLGTPAVTTTYVATYRPPDGGAPAAGLTYGCRRSGLLDEPFTLTIRVRDGVRSSDVTVNGTGTGTGWAALGSPLPVANVADLVGPTGTFSAGGRRTYDTSAREGVLNARWSGRIGGSDPRPPEFPLALRQTWTRDSRFVPWLTSSGGPEDFSCAYDLVATRQA